jgi:hypothetical protein
MTFVIYIQNDARSKRVNKWLYFKYLLTRQQMVFHLFFAMTVSIRSCVLFPTLCGSINTKSMSKTDNYRHMFDNKLVQIYPILLRLAKWHGGKIFFEVTN